jgi:hypothetical protein
MVAVHILTPVKRQKKRFFFDAGYLRYSVLVGTGFRSKISADFGRFFWVPAKGLECELAPWWHLLVGAVSRYDLMEGLSEGWTEETLGDVRRN